MFFHGNRGCLKPVFLIKRSYSGEQGVKDRDPVRMEPGQPMQAASESAVFPRLVVGAPRTGPQLAGKAGEAEPFTGQVEGKGKEKAGHMEKSLKTPV